MTGLETAIILIAFVTVASVLGYAVLSAGVFSAEQGKETIYAGLKEASTNLTLPGSVVGKSADRTGFFSAAIAPGAVHGLGTAEWFAADTGQPPPMAGGRLHLPAARGLGFAPTGGIAQ